MNLKPFIIYFTAFLLVGQNAVAQKRYLVGAGSLTYKTFSKVLVDKHLKDTFSFAKNWDYSWEVFKDDSTGEFSKNDDEPITPADTAHLFFTANCSTNVQGGYDIRYCFANKTKDGLILIFSDGLPAYASEFYVHIQGDSFYFEPQTVYPALIPGQKTSYQVTKQRLMLNKSRYSLGDIIIGYVDMEFTETVSIPEKGTQKDTFYLRGYIRTGLKRQP
ncbi:MULTISPECIES: hypothetical protein [unclassified Microcoleus]|uniref:hypothetical protein n=1 Tax=unclassified Microcoleus TaxID=2642155 RepID=UPI002FD24E1F